MVFLSEVSLIGNFPLEPVLKVAKQNAWVSFLLAGIIGVITTLLMSKLSQLYPNKTLIQYSQEILGKWLGKLIALFYVPFWFTIMGILIRGSSDFIKMVLLNRTPLWMIVLLMIMIMIYSNILGGIASIARSSELIGPLMFVFAFLPLFLNPNQMDWKQLLPIFHKSSLPILKGSLTALAWIGETTMILMLGAFMNQPKKDFSRVWGAVAFGSLWGLLGAMTAILIFGPSRAANIENPQFMVFKTITILEFIQNFDLFIIFFMLFAIFNKLSSHLFVSGYGLAQFFNVKNWKVMIWVLAITLFISVILTTHLHLETILFKPWIIWILLTYNIAIPLLLWVVGSIKKRINNKPAS